MIKEKHSLFKYIRSNNQPDHPLSILKDRLLLMFYLAGIYVLFTLLHIGCPIRFATGISCPGCGMTRAYYSLLHLDFGLALHYHPLFMLVPLMVVLYLFDYSINPRLLRILWVFIIISFLTTYLIRLFILQSNVVTIDISSGIMIKLYQFIIGGR